jgi:hypothetical protein
MKRYFLVWFLVLLSGLSLFAQEEKQEVYPNFTLGDIVVFKEYSFKNSKEEKKYKELEADLRVVYPLLQIVRSEYERINKEMGLYNPKSQKDFLKWYENYANENFKPLLGQLNAQQGRLFLKLISRELDTTPYNLIKKYRNGYSAMVWQFTARMFMANLRVDYEEEKNPMIEHIMRKLDAEHLTAAVNYR